MTEDKPSQVPVPGDDDVMDITLRDVPRRDADVAAAASAVRIRLDASVRQQMLAYASTDTTRELGGMLIGSVQDSAIPVVTVEAMIPARYTESVQASITFTYQTWQDIHAVKDRVYPEKKIIGWYHTHPGFGIFLSSYDQHIHTNFFTLPWQVAYVVDPLAHTEGFFRWEGGAVRKTADYELFGETAPVAPHPPPRRQRSQWHDPRNYLLALLAVVVIYLGAIHRSTSAPPTAPPARVAPPATPPPRPQPPARTPPAPAPADLTGPLYTVRPRETLWAISLRCYGAAHAATGVQVIRAANHLTGAKIYAGMRLRVPGGILAGKQRAQ
jgi:proteasome lid subunit RPN8/RPN11